MKKSLAIIIILLLLANLILFALQKINQLTFWLIIAAGGITSYFLKKT